MGSSFVRMNTNWKPPSKKHLYGRGRALFYKLLMLLTFEGCGLFIRVADAGRI